MWWRWLSCHRHAPPSSAFPRSTASRPRITSGDTGFGSMHPAPSAPCSKGSAKGSDGQALRQTKERERDVLPCSSRRDAREHRAFGSVPLREAAIQNVDVRCRLAARPARNALRLRQKPMRAGRYPATDPMAAMLPMPRAVERAR